MTSSFFTLLVTILSIASLGVNFAVGQKNEAEWRYDYCRVKVYLDLASTGLPTKSLCARFPVDHYPLPSNNETIRFKVENRTDVRPDDREGVKKVGSDTLLFMLARGQYTMDAYLKYAKDHGASGLIVKINFSDKNLTRNFLSNKTTLPLLKTFVLMDAGYAAQLEEEMEQREVFVEITGTESNDEAFEWSTVILGLLAIFCVIVGALTAPYYEPPGSQSTHQQILDSEGNETIIQTPPSPLQVFFTVKIVIMMVALITTVLMLLYFFFDYLVYFFMVIFCIASGRALFEILAQLLNLCNMDDRVTKVKGHGIHRWLLALFCTAVPIVWFVLRKADYIWILEDVLGICFCIHLIQSMKIPTLKICTILLSLLFVYDVFFVFITPFFTSDGRSIMVEVATGGGGGETLPLLLSVPRLKTPPTCFVRGFSLLGFGDIILPGLLVSFANAYDILKGKKCDVYFLTAIIGYTLGLSLAFVALHLTQTGQPALLYIVPCTLIPIFMVSLCKKETSDIWDGIARSS